MFLPISIFFLIISLLHAEEHKQVGPKLKERRSIYTNDYIDYLTNAFVGDKVNQRFLLKSLLISIMDPYEFPKKKVDAFLSKYGLFEPAPLTIQRNESDDECAALDAKRNPFLNHFDNFTQCPAPNNASKYTIKGDFPLGIDLGRFGEVYKYSISPWPEEDALELSGQSEATLIRFYKVEKYFGCKRYIDQRKANQILTYLSNMKALNPENAMNAIVPKILRTHQNETAVVIMISANKCGNLSSQIFHEFFFERIDARFSRKINETFEQMLRYLAANLLGTIDELHSKGFLHTNLAPQTIFLSDSMVIQFPFYVEEFVRKSRVIGRGCHHRMLTKRYPATLPPEVFRKKCIYDRSSEYFSIGVVLYYMIYEEYPFGETIAEQQEIYELYWKEPKEIITRIKDKMHNYGFSVDATDFIGSLMEFSQTKRPSADDWREHPWFDGINWNLTRINMKHWNHFEYPFCSFFTDYEQLVPQSGCPVH